MSRQHIGDLIIGLGIAVVLVGLMTILAGPLVRWLAVGAAPLGGR